MPGAAGSADSLANVGAGGSAAARRPVWGGRAARAAGAMIWRSVLRVDVSAAGVDRAIRRGPAAEPMIAAGGVGRTHRWTTGPAAVGGAGGSTTHEPGPGRSASHVAVPVARRSVLPADAGAGRAASPVWGGAAPRVAGAMVWRRGARAGGAVADGNPGLRPVTRRNVVREGSASPVQVGSGAGGPGAIVWRSVAREEAGPVVAGRGGYETAPAALGRVLPGGPTRLPAATTVFRSTQAAVAGVLAGARTDRVAPPRMSVAAPVTTLEPAAPPMPPMPAGSSNGIAAETRQPGLGPPQPAGHPAPTTQASMPADTAAPAPAAGSAPPGLPGGGSPPVPPGGRAEPPARWRLSDIDPADLGELAELVMERIEGRVRGELERRGRRGVPGVF